MLDLAMGKYVLVQDEPLSTRMHHRGVRRESSANGRFAYYFVWDVPDIFANIDEAALDAALLNVARRLHRSGRRPSSWIYEGQQRAEAVRQARSAPDSTTFKDAAAWLNGDFELKRAVGAGPEHPRAVRVRVFVANVLAAPTIGNPNTSTPARLRLFSGFPSRATATRNGRSNRLPRPTPFCAVPPTRQIRQRSPFVGRGHCWRDLPARPHGRAVSSRRLHAGHRRCCGVRDRNGSHGAAWTARRQRRHQRCGSEHADFEDLASSGTPETFLPEPGTKSTCYATVNAPSREGNSATRPTTHRAVRWFHQMSWNARSTQPWTTNSVPSNGWLTSRARSLTWTEPTTPAFQPLCRTWTTSI